MPRRPILPVLLALLALAAPAGCGSDDGGSGYGSRDSTGDSPTATATTPEAPPGASARVCEGTIASTEDLRVTGIGCAAGLRLVAAWTAKPACAAPAGGSRFSCSVEDGYRCMGTAGDRGVAVSCARPGASASFVVRPG